MNTEKTKGCFETDKYCHIPLCFLNFDRDIRYTAKHLLSFCIYDRALRISFGVDDDEIIQTAADVLNGRHYAISDFDEIRESHEIANYYIDNFEKKYGIDARARIHFSVIQDTAQEKFKPVHFRTLVAIMSCIHRDHVQDRITLDTLQIRTLGFKKQAVFDNEINQLNVLTRRQLEYARNQLSKKGFFEFYTYGRRVTQYSIKLSKKELMEKAAIREAQKRYASSQAEFDNLVKEKLSEIASKKLENLSENKRYFNSPDIPSVIRVGERNNTLTSIAGKYRYLGYSQDDTFSVLIDINNTVCEIPLSEFEVANINKSVNKYYEKR